MILFSELIDHSTHMKTCIRIHPPKDVAKHVQNKWMYARSYACLFLYICATTHRRCKICLRKTYVHWRYIWASITVPHSSNNRTWTAKRWCSTKNKNFCQGWRPVQVRYVYQSHTALYFALIAEWCMMHLSGAGVADAKAEKAWNRLQPLLPSKSAKNQVSPPCCIVLWCISY